MSTLGSARALAGAVPNLLVDATRMRAKLDAMRAALPKGTADQWFDAALALHAGSWRWRSWRTLSCPYRAKQFSFRLSLSKP